MKPNPAHKHNDAAYQVEKLLRDFATVTSRQLTRILCATLGELKYALDANDLEAARKALGVGLRAGEHALGLARDLRFLASETAMKTETVDVSQLLLDTSELVEKEVASRSIDFNVLVEGSTYVAIDRTSLRQVILNVLYYAIDTTPIKGSLSLHLARNTHSIHITVSNSHPPDPAEQQNEIFDPLKAEHLSEVRALGLTVAKALVDAMGGEVGVTTLLGNETTFSIVIPVGRPALIPNFQHKRKHRRIRIELPAVIMLKDCQPIKTHITILGAGGCYIQLDGRLPLEKGDPCDLKINHFGHEWIELNGSHITNLAHQNDQLGVGIAFGEIPVRAQNIISALVRGHTD